MKKSLLFLIIIFATFYQSGIAQKSSVPRTNADSLTLNSINPGDVFIVGLKFSVYLNKKELEKDAFMANEKIELEPGTKFKVLEISKISNIISACIELPDSSKAYAINLKTLRSCSYSEGENVFKTRIRFFLQKGLEFRASFFWYLLLVTFLTSVLFLIFSSKINRLIAKWAQIDEADRKSGYIFLLATAIVGSVTGLTILFHSQVFKDFAIQIPMLRFPSGSRTLLKFYWSLQPLFLLFFGYILFKYIRLYGTKVGITAAVILLIPAFAIFWSSMILSFLVALATIIIIIMSAMGSTATSDLMNPQPKNAVKYRTNSMGTEERFEIKYDNDGFEKSRKNL